MFVYFIVIASFGWLLTFLGTDSYDLETPVWIAVGISIVLSLVHVLQCIDILNRKVENAGSGSVMLFASYGLLFGPVGIILAVLIPSSYLVPSSGPTPVARSGAAGAELPGAGGDDNPNQPVQ